MKENSISVLKKLSKKLIENLDSVNAHKINKNILCKFKYITNGGKY